MRISDWSSDVCSSDLRTPHRYILGVAALNDLGDADFDVRNVERPERRAVPRRSRRSGKSLGAEEAGEGDADAPATTRQRSSRFALHSHEHSPRHRPPTGQALPIYYVSMSFKIQYLCRDRKAMRPKMAEIRESQFCLIRKIVV